MSETVTTGKYSVTDSGIRRITFGSTLCKISCFSLLIISIFFTGVYFGTKGIYQETILFLSESVGANTNKEESIKDKIFLLLKKIDANAEVHGKMATIKNYERQKQILDRTEVLTKVELCMKYTEIETLNRIAENRKLIEQQQRAANIITNYYEGKCQ